MVDECIRDKIEMVYPPWGLAEMDVAMQLLDDFEKLRQEVNLQRPRTGRGELENYIRMREDFDLQLGRQIELWQVEASNYDGNRKIESSFHARFWQERRYEELERHSIFLSLQRARWRKRFKAILTELIGLLPRKKRHQAYGSRAYEGNAV